MIKNKTSKVCIVIPAYNEEQVIGGVIKDTHKVFEKSDFNFEIVVVNDQSTDDTSDVAYTAGATTIDHIINRGAGGATSTGLRYAEENGFDIVATMDADGQHDPQDVMSCIKKSITAKSDLLIGSRLLDTKGMSRTKILGNKGLSFVTWILFGVNVTDSQSGLRVFSKNTLKILEWKSTGYEFCSEMIWRAKQAGLKIDEHSIKAIYTDYSRSKGQNNWNGINIVKSLLKRRIVEMFE
jgi:glycosyltransferase involved in cell wall biosynthesis